MEEDPDKSTKFYGVIMVIALLVLALFWSVDKSFRWILFGLALASGLTYLLKKRAFDFRLTDFLQQPAQKAKRHYSQQPIVLTTSQKGALYFGVGTIIALVLAFFIYAVSAGFENPEGDEQAVEIISEEPLTTFTNSTDADEVLDQGNSFYNNSQFDSATIYYKRALELRPGFKEAYYNIALIYSSQSDYANAIVTMQECLQSHPDYGEGLQLMGTSYARQERNDEAFPFFERAYATGMRNAELSHYLGYLYDLKNNVSQALVFYKEAVQQDSTKVDVFKRLAELEPEKAKWYLKKAEELSASK